MSTDKVTPMPPKQRTRGERIEYYIDWRNPPKEGDPHPEIDVYVSLQDTVHWHCDKKFRVLRVDSNAVNPKAPYPFYRHFPEDAPGFAFQVNSGPVRPEAGYEYLYKPVFTFEDTAIPDFDPHIRTHQRREEGNEGFQGEDVIRAGGDNNEGAETLPIWSGYGIERERLQIVR